MSEPTNPFAPPSTPRTPSGPVPPSSHQAAGPDADRGARATEQIGVPSGTYARPASPPVPPVPHAPPAYLHDPGSGYPSHAHGGAEAATATDSWGRPLPQRRERRGLSAVWIAPLVVLSLVAGGIGGWLADEVLDGRRPTDAALPVAGSSGSDEPAEGVAAIAAQVLPSVVSIEVRGAEGLGTGSGFVLRDDGYILTNNHVVSTAAGGGAEIAVLFSDGSEESAEIVGRTADYDLAVLRVERTGLRPLALADSDEVRVGDAVVAVGAPLGLQGTVTTGIVSALNRPVSAGNAEETAFINAIQTDAAINPGNSGGPLVNGAGDVVGINSAIAQPPGLNQAAGSIGLGFAIPSNQARRTAEELIETGTATYPVIGVLLDTRYTGEGVQVTTETEDGQAPVTPGGPADAAGIRPGDVITEIDGRPVTDDDELIVAIRAKAPGDAVTLMVRSEGEEPREVRVVLDQLSSD